MYLSCSTIQGDKSQTKRGQIGADVPIINNMILHILIFFPGRDSTAFAEACVEKLCVVACGCFYFYFLPDARLQKQPRLVDATLPGAKKTALWIKSPKDRRWWWLVNTVIYLFIYFFAACRKRSATEERSPTWLVSARASIYISKETEP